MRALLLTVLIATSGPLAAESPKAPSQSQPVVEKRPAVLMLASNDTARPRLTSDAQSQLPPKGRIARITTCRCGDPQPDPESGSEQQ